MTDPDLLAKKLAAIETYVAELRRWARIDRLGEDIREERFVERTLQLAIQATLDAASHVVADDRLGEPRTNRELFDLLARGGVVSHELAESLGRAAGLRNLLVHDYGDIDTSLLASAVTDRLDDLLDFAAELRRRYLAAS